MFESVKIIIGQSLENEELAKDLVEIGYNRAKGITEIGDFSIKGENIFVYPATFEYPVRIELSIDKVKKISSIDILTFKSIQDHNAVIILPIKGISKAKRVYRKKFLTDLDPIDNFVDIEPGDYVVHIDYGIGKFIGIKKIKTKKGEEKTIAIEYKDGDVLYAPFSDLDKIQKYIYFSTKRPNLYKLGGKAWQRTKERASKGVRKVALEILYVQAKRASLEGHKFSSDTDWQKVVENSFPYKETEGQIIATNEVKRDMESPRPMDRLLCGDVGYGKTEVALRAAFKAVMDNKQAAILVPTTILAEQHYSTFKDRLKDFPCEIEMLSRFRTKREQEEIVKKLKEGVIDIVIGTHRLISPDVAFKDLGIVVIDEEQRFGVRHKEELKKLRLIVDVLTLTATPIPRTLYLALMGGREISIINTPPLERQPIETHVIEFDEDMIRQAVERELNRNGQVYFVHNRVLGIEHMANRIKKIIPKASLEIAHGKMSEHALEKTMIKFIKKEIDILLCTTIIESGIDIPNANTLIVNEAENFGLADLYQLRGRVGRFSRKAYAYFVVHRRRTLTHDVQRRLEALGKFSALGSGFKIAMQDLEMRGAGNLLGIEQHGYIEQIGFDLYCRLLRSAIDSLK